MHSELFAKIRGRVQNLLDPIYLWNISDDEFRELENELKKSRPGGVEDELYHNAAKCNFLIWCAEQYRRNLFPGATWENVLAPLKYDDNAVNQRTGWIADAERGLGREPLNAGNQYHKRVYAEGGLPVHLFEGKAARTYLDAIRYLVRNNSKAYAQGLEEWRKNGLPIPNGRPGGDSYWEIFLELAWTFVRNLLENNFQATLNSDTKVGKIDWLLKNADLGVAKTLKVTEFIDSLLDEQEVQRRNLPWWPEVDRVLVLDREPILKFEIQPRSKIESSSIIDQGNSAKIFVDCMVGESVQRVCQYKYDESRDAILRVPNPMPPFKNNGCDAVAFRLKQGDSYVVQQAVAALDLEEDLWVFSKNSEGKWVHNPRIHKCSFPAIFATKEEPSFGERRGILKVDESARVLVEVANKEDLPTEFMQRVMVDFPSLLWRDAKTKYGESLVCAWDEKEYRASFGWPTVNHRGARVLMAETLNEEFKPTPIAMPQAPGLYWFCVQVSNGGALHTGPKRRLLVLPNLFIERPIRVDTGVWAVSISSVWNMRALGKEIEAYPEAVGARWDSKKIHWTNVTATTSLRYRWGEHTTFKIPSPVIEAYFAKSNGEFSWEMGLPELQDAFIRIRSSLGEKVSLNYSIQLRDESQVGLNPTNIALQEVLYPKNGSATISLMDIGNSVIPKLFDSTNSENVSVDVRIRCQGQPVGRRILIRRYSQNSAFDRYFMLSPVFHEENYLLRDDECSENLPTGIWMRIPSNEYGMKNKPEIWNGLHQPTLAYVDPKHASTLTGLRKTIISKKPDLIVQGVHGWLRENSLDQDHQELIERTFLTSYAHHLPAVSLSLIPGILSDDITLQKILLDSPQLQKCWPSIAGKDIRFIAFDWRMVRYCVVEDLIKILKYEQLVAEILKAIKGAYDYKEMGDLNSSPCYLTPPERLEIPQFHFKQLYCEFEKSSAWQEYSGYKEYYNNHPWTKALIWLAWFSVHATRVEYNRHHSMALAWFKQLEAIYDDFCYVPEQSYFNGAEKNLDLIDSEWFAKCFRQCQVRAIACLPS